MKRKESTQKRSTHRNAQILKKCEKKQNAEGKKQGTRTLNAKVKAFDCIDQYRKLIQQQEACNINVMKRMTTAI